MMPLTPRNLVLTIGLIAALLSIVLDKRKIGLRKTLPQIHSQITRATPVVRFLQFLTLGSFVIWLVLSFD